MSYLTSEELARLGLKSYGENVKISAKASLYSCRNISIGSNVRIDDYCVLSAGEGGLEIGSYVHVAVNSLLVGASKITLSDFSGVSSRVSIYSSSDDYSGRFLTNPTVPAEFTNVSHGEVVLGRHAIVGAGTVILPGVTIGDGTAVGALSLVTKSCEDFYIYAGNPARKLKRRKADLLQLERNFLNANN